MEGFWYLNIASDVRKTCYVYLEGTSLSILTPPQKLDLHKYLILLSEANSMWFSGKS